MEGFFFELEELLELSVEDSLFGDFSVVASVFFELLLLLVDSGLLAASEAGLLVVLALGDAVVAGTGVGDIFLLTVALAAGVELAAADAVAAGVMVAATLAVAAGVALALVEPAVVEVVPVVVVPVVVLALTLNDAGTDTP